GVRRALDIVDLAGFQQRPAPRLSGGQQQRVALARAIVHEPRLLLLDEPLSNLDAQLRDEMRGELKRLQSKIGITTVYVTHDQSEALALSDRIAVIDQGRITQIGSPQDLYFRPANPFGAACRVDVTSDGVNLQVTAPADMALPAEGEVLLLFAPERTVALPGRAT